MVYVHMYQWISLVKLINNRWYYCTPIYSKWVDMNIISTMKTSYVWNENMSMYTVMWIVTCFLLNIQKRMNFTQKSAITVYHCKGKSNSLPLFTTCLWNWYNQRTVKERGKEREREREKREKRRERERERERLSLVYIPHMPVNKGPFPH